jgi:hypothetical protein
MNSKSVYVNIILLHATLTTEHGEPFCPLVEVQRQMKLSSISLLLDYSWRISS